MKTMISEAQKRAAERYRQKCIKGVYLKLNVNTDADILEKLEGVENVQGYIKNLIRADSVHEMHIKNKNS